MKLLTIILLLSLSNSTQEFTSSVLESLFEKKPPSNETFFFVLFSGKKINDLGAFHDCLRIKDAEYVRVTFNQEGYKSLGIGLCLRKDCIQPRAKSMIEKKIKEHFPKQRNIRLVIPREEKEGNLSSIRFYLFIPIFSVFLMLILISLISKKWFDLSSPFLSQFDPALNADYLFTPMKPSKTSFMNGLRFIAILGVCYGNFNIIFLNAGYIENYQYLREFYKSFHFAIVTSCYFAVDLFFFLSGFLFRLNYEKAKEMPVIRKIGLGFLSRYLRLLPMLLFALYGVEFVLNSFANNVLEDKSTILTQNCPQNGWVILLYLQNFISPSHCNKYTWYLANDMQFFLFSILVVSIVKKKTIQDLIFGSVLVVSLVVSFCLSYFEKFGYNEFLNGAPQDERFTDEYYIKPYTRIAPYILGMFFYNLYSSAEKTEDVALLETNSDFSVYDKFNIQLRQSKICVFAYKSLGFGLVFGIILVNWIPNTREERLSVWIAALLNTSSKMIFTLGLGIISHVIVLGKSQFVSSILNIPIFSFFTKIGYAQYMLHMHIIMWVLTNFLNSYELSSILMIIYFIGIFTLSTVFSLTMSLVFDTPIERGLKQILKK